MRTVGRKTWAVWRTAQVAAIFGLLASGCSTTGSVMTKASLKAQPGEGQVLVTFIRPGILGGAITFGIWDSGNLVGVLGAGECIQYETVPGEHYFLARAENWSCVKADLAPNRRYVIKANPFMGVWKARVAFDPLTQSDYAARRGLEQVKGWLKKLRPVMPNPSQVEAYVQPRLEQVLEAKAMFQSGGGRSEIMTTEDTLPD